MHSIRLDLARLIRRCCASLFVGLAFLAAPAQAQDVRLVEDDSGIRLQVDGGDFMVLGVNWDYFPRGTTYNYDFWGQPDDFIREALDREMSLLQEMGGNTIRTYAGIPPRWVEYIYDQYGIFTVVNHPLGRYGLDVQGRYVPNTDYSDPASRAQLMGEVEALVREFEGTRGMLMWLLGNENNYGLVWESAETEDLPVGEANAVRARYMYSLFGETVDAIKAIDDSRPIAMANGDLQYLDIIAEEVPNLDVFGSNVYRGISFVDFFDEVDRVMGIPVLFTEFGADAFDARRMREDQVTQARYLIGQWEEIYANAAGNGRVGNSIGGMTFQWTDGWWKFGQEDRLDIHDTNASWSNQGYLEDWAPGENNMNEEWWGIIAKGPTDPYGHYDLYPRAAYHALKWAYELDPYQTDAAEIEAHFDGIDPTAAAEAASGATDAREDAEQILPLLRGVRAKLETYSTGGSVISTPESDVGPAPYPSFQGFDQLQAFWFDLGARPRSNIDVDVSVAVFGNIADNPIDQIFYENQGRPTVAPDGSFRLDDAETAQIYSAHFSWDARDFRLDGFYRTGHYHWGYEGDMFGLYREANYGPNVDIYNGRTPYGFEFSGKRALEGLKIAYGPELWWGANPAILAKYQTEIAGYTVTGVFQNDFERAEDNTSSFAVPQPQNRAATLVFEREFGAVGLEFGGIWSGSNRVGRTFQLADGETGNYRLFQDDIRDSDTFGGRARVTWSGGAINWYAQAAAMGLVADGGPTQIQTYTGWRLADSGSGNQRNFLSGFTWTSGKLQIAPNFLWQRPLVGPVPSDVQAPGRPRNILEDPFVVRANREMTAAEILFTWDPTPATWMYNWDSDIREDAAFAASIGFVYRHLPTTQDAAIGILGDGRTFFAFPGAAPAEDLWDVHARIVSKRRNGIGLILNAYAGTGQANGDSERTIDRFGADLRAATGRLRFETGFKVDDWGPYDYHRDFNLTFPLQVMADVAWSFGLPEWVNVPQTRIGVRGAWRSLDQYSPRYCPGRVPAAGGGTVCDPTAPGDEGSEWEIRSYIHLAF